MNTEAFQIKVGRMPVMFCLRNDEDICKDEYSGWWTAEFLGLPDADGIRQWVCLGAYETKEAAAVVLYKERLDFSAVYGA